jgi:hypothetical protein
MRFAQQIQTGDTTRAGKLMPLWLSHHGDVHIRHDPLAKRSQQALVAQNGGGTSGGIHNPFGSR